MTSETQHPENPFQRTYEDWRQRTPMVCRAVAQGLVVCYIVSWVVDLSKVLANVPMKIVYKLQVYRLVTSPLVGHSLLGTLFAAVTIGDGVGPRLERSLGTTGFAASLLTAVVVINAGYTALCASLAFGGAPALDLIPSQGPWPALLYAVAFEALSGPEATRRLLCFPVDVPILYYPLALLGLFFLLAGPQLDMALGVGIGYADRYGYLSSFKPSVGLATRLEAALPGLTADPGFVSARAALGAAAWVPLSTVPDWASDDAPRGGGAVPDRGFASFFQAIQRRVNQSDTDAPSSRFPNSPGSVLGSAPSSTAAGGAGSSVLPVQAHPVSSDDIPIAVAVPSSRTAAANRATILAAVEKRTTSAVNNV